MSVYCETEKSAGPKREGKIGSNINACLVLQALRERVRIKFANTPIEV